MNSAMPMTRTSSRPAQAESECGACGAKAPLVAVLEIEGKASHVCDRCLGDHSFLIQIPDEPPALLI